MIDTIFLDKYEDNLTQELLKLCTNYKMLDGTLLSTDDIDDQWKVLAPEYMADAVPQIAQYPTVSVAWAGYLGLAIAQGWDTNWEMCKNCGYKDFYGPRGFDDMDEHILFAVLGLAPESEESRKIEDMMRRCGEKAVSLIRHEQIDPQTAMAFHVFARTCRTMYRIGAAIELHRLGYKFEKVYMS